MSTSLVLDEKEAPLGYKAVLKSSVPQEGNLCRQCDFRSQCNGFLYRCMPGVIVTASGEEIERQDNCSVLFKRIENET